MTTLVLFLRLPGQTRLLVLRWNLEVNHCQNRAFGAPPPVLFSSPLHFILFSFPPRFQTVPHRDCCVSARCHCRHPARMVEMLLCGRERWVLWMIPRCSHLEMGMCTCLTQPALSCLFTDVSGSEWGAESQPAPGSEAVSIPVIHQ